MSEATRVPIEVVAMAGLWRTTEEVLAIFHVPYDCAAASANKTRGVHYGKRHQQDEIAHAAGLWAWLEAGQPALEPPVVVDVLVFRQRVIDGDNAVSGCKALGDAIFKKRALPDDSLKFLSWRNVKMVTGDRFAGPNAWTVLICRSRSD